MDLPEEEKQLSQKEKLEKAQKLVSNNEYRNKRGTIMREVSGCLDQLLEKTKNRQQRANTIFSDMYLKLEIAIMILVILLLSICIIVRKLIVVPLVYYNKSIMEGEIFPVIGAAELQKWAETYNKVFKENDENYGYRRITDELHHRGHQVNHKKVYRLMKKLGIRSIKFSHKTRKYRSYKGKIGTIAKNRINRRFHTPYPYQKLTTDVTEFKT